MITHLTVSLLVILAGSIGMLLVLLLWFSDKALAPEIESGLDPILGARDQAAIHDTHAPFIPMPDHLRTRDEMVTWMTKELPKLTADMQNPRT